MNKLVRNFVAKLYVPSPFLWKNLDSDPSLILFGVKNKSFVQSVVTYIWCVFRGKNKRKRSYWCIVEPRVLSDLSIMQLKPGMHTKRHGMEVMDHHMDNIKKEMIYLYPPVLILMEILLPNRAVSFIFTFLCIIFLYCTWLLSVLTLLLRIKKNNNKK